MMTDLRIEPPIPLTLIPDVPYGEAGGMPLILDVIASQGQPDATGEPHLP